ncbi:MAG: alanine--tRNA ligase [Planctomycetota bacterium]
MRTNEIRRGFLEFFREHGHVVYPSDRIYPANDPSLLFTSAGMTQFKDMFLGVGRLPFARATTCQKCLRMPDIEKVGKSARHHTFFEMLGNFSFGDYFKEEAIEWAWELLLRRWRIPEKRLVVTIYEDDEEAFRIWNEKIGVPTEKITRLGADENFWPANAPAEGPNGPCGPCSEIHFDHGKGVGCGRKDCGPSCDCDRFVEIWNLVFTQYDRQSDGSLTPLPRKNIDTGMGLERMARVLQGKLSNYETDLFAPTIARLCDIAGISYEEIVGADGGRRVRRVADHVRALCVAVADGVFPSNEGRGYVIRRLLRRAVSDGDHLGIREHFLDKLVQPVVAGLGEAYPELVERRRTIERILVQEEEKFRATLDAGTAILEDALEKLSAAGGKVMDGEQAFRLYDTYGFPLEMTRAIAEERGLSVDEQGFRTRMEAQREKARSASALSGEIFAHDAIVEIVQETPATKFVGYEGLECRGKVLVIAAGTESVERIGPSAGEALSVVLDQTPFYGEAGGQVGDGGKLSWSEGEMEVTEVVRVDDVFVHRGRVLRGELAVGATVNAQVDPRRRREIAANHTATHVLHWALREVLGEHATQSGSLVAPDRLRFDFAHAGQVMEADLERIERMVNQQILEADRVTARETTLEEAKAQGVTALFGEKYGDRVRVLGIGGFSKELCGGTHVANLAEIGLFKIVGEEAVASGIRRITAVTRMAAYEAFRAGDSYALEAARILGVKREELAARVKTLLGEVKDLRKELSRKRASGQGVAPAETIDLGGVKLAVYRLSDSGAEDLRVLADEIVKGKPAAAAVLVAVSAKGVSAVVAVAPDVAKQGPHAGNIAKRMAQRLGGGGGGRPTMGQAGGSRIDAVEEALEEAKRAFRESLMP